MRINFKMRSIALLLALVFLLGALFGCRSVISLDEIPEYSGASYVEINGGEPFFTDDEITTVAFESYSILDTLGRCGVAFACIGIELMPTEPREGDLDTEPSGWVTNGDSNNNNYDFILGGYVYNRCHLIGFQLAGENDNPNNLITGTRYMNIEGMLPFENMVADYVKRTENHVMYRVTPIFKGIDALARGVLIEGYSVEDSGRGICFCIYAYNVQPGVAISYLTGQNAPAGSGLPSGDNDKDGEIFEYILNTSSKKFHLPGSSCGEKVSDKNRQIFTGTRGEVIELGYDPCGTCKP